MPRRISCDSYTATAYIEKNINRLERDEIIKNLMKITKLAKGTLQSLYYVVYSSYKESEEKTIVKEVYKERERNFFKFDTSKLWRNI
ncbi:hypothetical protein ACQPUZ_04725 [Clostridium tertium]